jgi:hypothetical protein
MNKIISLILLGSVFSVYSHDISNVSTTSAVTLSGAILKGSSMPINAKYKRKDCPICKGTGFYISGDGIKKVDCGYCEPPNKSTYQDAKPIPSVLKHNPVIIKENCPNGVCPLPKK